MQPDRIAPAPASLTEQSELFKPSTWPLPEQIQGLLGVLSFLTLIVVVIGAYFSSKSAKASLDGAEASRASASTSAKQLQMAERPWISETVNIASPLTFDSNGMNLTLDFRLQNSGHTPATSVFVYAEFVEPVPNHKASLQQKNSTCNKAMSAAIISEATIYPGAEGRQQRKFRLSPSALQRNTKGGYIPLTVATCSFYLGATDDTVGYKLGHIYQLSNKSTKRLVFISGEDVQLEDLEISTPGEKGTITGPERYHVFPGDSPVFNEGSGNLDLADGVGPFINFVGSQHQQ